MPGRMVVFGTVMLVVVLAACGAPDQAADPDCVPTIDASVPDVGDPDRRIEDIIEAMTGERQTSDEDPVEETIDDPNFAGVWGNMKGGIVVAVVDCSLVDVDEIATIAGGSDAVSIIEVDHNWWEVNNFRDLLIDELVRAGMPFDVAIESTVAGRNIVVRTPDVNSLPDGFGSAVPSSAYSVIESDTIPQEE